MAAIAQAASSGACFGIEGHTAGLSPTLPIERCAMMMKACLLLACAVAVIATAPASAQRKTHGAGVSSSGTHGGVSWDGGHAYGGGDYSGYPAASAAMPAYRPIPPAYQPPRFAPPAAEPARSDRPWRHDDLSPAGHRAVRRD